MEVIFNEAVDRAADCDVVDPPPLPPPPAGTVAAWNLVKTVSAGWHSRTDAAPDTQPAMKSTYASDRLVSFVEVAEDESDIFFAFFVGRLSLLFSQLLSE